MELVQSLGLNKRSASIDQHVCTYLDYSVNNLDITIRYHYSISPFDITIRYHHSISPFDITITLIDRIHVCTYLDYLVDNLDKRRMCCLLVLNSVTSTSQWIRQPKPRDVVHDVCVLVCDCV